MSKVSTSQMAGSTTTNNNNNNKKNNDKDSDGVSGFGNGGGNGDTFFMELVGNSTYYEYTSLFKPMDHGLSKDFKFSRTGDTREKYYYKLDRDETKLFEEILWEDKESENIERSMILPCEDTSVTKLDHLDLYLVETSNLLNPIIDDPYLMGKIACSSVLSGIYALGIAKVTNIRLFLGISNRIEINDRNIVMSMVIRGFKDTAKTAGTLVRGCQIIGNPWSSWIGGTASTVCTHQQELVPPDGATIGDVIVLTKPLGTTLAITLYQWMEQPEKRARLLLTVNEEDVKRAYCRAVDSMTRTNRVAAILMRKYNAHAACEVSSYGILGHAELLVRRQRNNVNFVIHNMPVIAKMCGLSKITGSSMPLLRGTIPEVSGGLLVVLPREQAAVYCKALEKVEHMNAWIVGIVESGERKARVIDRPRVIEVPSKNTTDSLW
ncbi:inactive selenide, water dikinase-like protein [Vespula pensylvanica]|uniref:PurM-like C-terminal domain-containing protein n=1 Tax=Vespula pensylvanica TaxID=30213 RepID=A0A834P893_VESPE|nr:inactive selenide, water dikinase-like protein [Vespula pensylvanica]KAF7432072.1 hypothetical protein H0235_004996 [Vespula pensylvanica]